MNAKEVGQQFLAKVCGYLVSLPFDLKILQEAAADPDLEAGPRDLAASVMLHIFAQHEGNSVEAFIEDVLLLRMALGELGEVSGEPADAFRARFPEVYEGVGEDLQVLQTAVGPDLWQWLHGRLHGCQRLSWRGRRACQYIADEDGLDTLYEAGVDFQTNFNVSEAQIKNRLRRPEQLTEYLLRRQRAERR